MSNKRLAYVLASELSPKMRIIADENGLVDDGFVLVLSRDVLKPWNATSIFSEDGKRFKEEMEKEKEQYE